MLAEQLGGRLGDALLSAARTAYTNAMHLTSLAGATILLATAAFARRALPTRHHPATPLTIQDPVPGD